MRNHTVTLFFVLLVVLFAALFFFWNHQHNLHAQNVYHGGMSQETKEKYLKQGIDCQETYELQGYEAPETILRMFSLSQHDFYNLNPGVGMNLQAGLVICVKGIWGVSKLSSSMDWFWPSMAVAAAVVGFFASYVMHHYRSSDSASKQHQHGHAHAHGGATA